MLQDVVVEVESRTDTGKNACRRLRKAGLVPGVVYGLDRPTFPVAAPTRRIETVLRMETGRNTLFNLVLASDKAKQRAVMIREIQRDPVTESMVHIDFVRVDLDKPIHVDVPVKLEGTPEGVKNEGGIVDFVHRRVQVECLPVNIPDNLSVDVSGLHVHQNVSAGELEVPEGIRVLDPPETILAVVIPPRTEVEEAPAEEEAAEEAAAEPEVAAKGKEAGADEGQSDQE